MSLRQPTPQERKEFTDIVNDAPTVVTIPGTKRTVTLTATKPYTIERLTQLWIEHDASIPKDSAEVLRSMSKDPYFAVKEALLFVLNGYYKIRFFYRMLCWWWGKVKGYTDDQMTAIIIEAKKKIPLEGAFITRSSTADMTNDLIAMRKKELLQYQQELLTVKNTLSAKNTPNTPEAD